MCCLCGLFSILFLIFAHRVHVKIIASICYYEEFYSVFIDNIVYRSSFVQLLVLQ